MPFENAGHSVESFNNVSSVGLMADSLMSAPAILFTNSDPDGTPVGKICWPRHHSVNSACQTILWHMGRAISATGKTKVGGNANFVLIRKVRSAG